LKALDNFSKRRWQRI